MFAKSDFPVAVGTSTCLLPACELVANKHACDTTSGPKNSRRNVTFN